MDSSPVAQRLRLAFELFEVGVGMYRQRMKRTYPDETTEEIEKRVSDWLLASPAGGGSALVAGSRSRFA